MTSQVCDVRTWGQDLTGRRGSIAVIGLGYIGLPTAVILAHHGWHVVGIDVVPDVVTSVNRGCFPFLEAGMDELMDRAVSAGSLEASSAMPAVDTYIISVPTPMTPEHEADLGAIDAVVRRLAEILRGGELIVLESTSPTGTTRRIAHMLHELRPDLTIDGVEAPSHDADNRVGASGSGTARNAKEDERRRARSIAFAYAPERVLPGRMLAELPANDRIIGGLTAEAAERAAAVYRTFCVGEVLCTSAATAELVKLGENAFRDVNIAFANELSLIAEREGVNVHEAIALANRHPRVNILQPGPGVGGHCIAVDPWFLVQAHPDIARLARAAREVNDSMPHRVLERLTREMARFVGRTTPPRVALLGLAFKPDVDDLRMSPALQIAHEAATSFPHVSFLLLEPNIRALPEELKGLSNVVFGVEVRAAAQADLVVLLVAHHQFRTVRRELSPDAVVLDVTGMWRE